MTNDLLFAIGNLVVLPFWFMMIALPRWQSIVRIIRSPLIAIAPALIYIYVLATVLTQPNSAFSPSSFSSLQGVVALLSQPTGALAGWVHFLAFDLLVGRWAYLDSIEKKIHPLLVAPCLFFVFMFGPVGFVLYLVVRAFKRN